MNPTIFKLKTVVGHLAITQAIHILSKGGLVVYPTETCYGLAADATNPAAIQKLLSYKRRREGKPLSILVTNETMANQYAKLNDSARRLYARFLPGPMTVISKAKFGPLAQGVISELGTVGIRISSYPLAMALVQQYGKPITATSANASWQKKPYSVGDIITPLSPTQLKKLDLILDAGPLPKRPASTVVDTTLVDSMVLRPGNIALGLERIEMVSTSEMQTQELAKTLMLKYWNKLRKRGIIFGLIGDLGTGKTVFAKGIGSFLHLSEPIVSPSYTLVNEYAYTRHGVSGMFYHLDPWRLETFDEVKKLNVLEQLRSNTVIVLEWANKDLAQLKSYAQAKQSLLVIVIFYDLGISQRRITVYED